MSYITEMLKESSSVKHMDPNDSRVLIAELMQGLLATAEEVVPWFVDQMPSVYFQDTDRATRLGHLRAIVAAKSSGRPPSLTLRSEDGSRWTFIRPLDYPGVLAELVRQLPTDQPLRAAKIHTAGDGQLVIDVFEFGSSDPFDPADPKQMATVKETLEFVDRRRQDLNAEHVRRHFSNCAAEYVLTITPHRFCRHYELWHRLSGTDGTSVELEQETDPNLSRIVVAVGNSRTRTMIERIATRLSRYDINIHRAYLDLLSDPGNGQISILGFVAQTADGRRIDEDSDLWHEIRTDLLRVKWIDQFTLELNDRHTELDLERTETIVALTNLVHQVLVKRNPYAFARDRLYLMVEHHLSLSLAIANLFADRFRPEGAISSEELRRRAAEIREDIRMEVDLEDARHFLYLCLDAVEASLRTNLYLEERYAMAIRIDPAFLTDEERDEVPFGVFFVHGRAFNGFHVRFRDIARGGVRAVRPLGREQHARETERLYDEAYGLAYAQQLKNKDIPEGGAKAVILIEPGEKIDRCFKAFSDSLLDLVTPDNTTRTQIVDYFGPDELLYLGPDENITPRMIEWIVDRARRRGYPLPNSLMSSKPGAGINHKEYGVTSEGVTVFLDVALRHVGIDPTAQPFTVKITGGPDGDVAGNEIRILHREYGENARILGIADGSGCAEDPDGLNHEGLLAMVARGEPIANFDPAKLGPGGHVASLDDADGVRLRNTMHNRIVADAFIPAGGRPRMLHIGNWKQHLTANGTPSSRVIVEGANLFLTPDARRELSDHGVMIFKDSSANKCGVICSSYEIIASMLLTEEEFLAIKPRFVDEVLTKLRMLARREAELLIRESRHAPHVPLPEMSIELSLAVIRAGDAIEASLTERSEEEWMLLRALVIDHLPPVLVERAGDRIWSQLPLAYIHWIIASALATRIVYREGLEFLKPMPQGAIADLAMRYLRQEKETGQLLMELQSSDIPHRTRIVELLERAGTRAGLRDMGWGN